MKKRLALVGFLALLFALSTVYAVQLTLDSDSVSRAGGTGLVAVLSPEADDTVNSVNFTAGCVGTTCGITGVNIEWDPAETGDYTIIVLLYDQTQNVLVSGQATTTITTTTTTPVTTSVTFASPVNPKDVYYVEVMIIQTTTQ